MFKITFHSIALLLCLLSNYYDTQGQLPEFSTFNTLDTIAINKQIEAGTKIGIRDPDSAKLLLTAALSQSNRYNYKQGIKIALNRLGILYLNQSKYDSAHRYFLETIKYCNASQDSILLARTYNYIGSALKWQVKLKDAMEAYNRAANYAIKSPKYLAPIYCNIGTVLKTLGQFDRAQYYYNKGIHIAVNIGDTSTWCGILMNKGMCFNEQKQYKESTIFLDSAVALARERQLYREWATAAVAISNLYLATNKPKEALTALEEILRWDDSIMLHARERNFMLVQAGTVYLELKRYEAAERHLKQALITIKDDRYNYMVALSKLEKLSAATGDYRQAYNYSKELYELHDSLANNEIKMQVNELETKYRIAEKDKTIAEHELNMSKQENRLGRQRNWIGGVASGSLLLLLLLSWRYSHARQKHKRLQSQMEIEQLKAAMEGEEKERARIASELHDGIVAELTAIKMNLEATSNRLSPPPDGYQQNLNELSTVINDVRNTAHNLMPEILLRHGLAEALGLLCESIVKTGRLAIDYQQYGDFAPLPMDTRQQVYRIIQELLHNIIKHARASQALLQTSCHERLLTVHIEDNGIGMAKQQHNSNMGLFSIRQRVKQLNGNIEWTTSAGNGTQVYLEFEI